MTCENLQLRHGPLKRNQSYYKPPILVSLLLATKYHSKNGEKILTHLFYLTRSSDYDHNLDLHFTARYLRNLRLPLAAAGILRDVIGLLQCLLRTPRDESLVTFKSVRIRNCRF